MVSWNNKFSDLDLNSCCTGAHIPDISSPIGMFDIIHLGIFVTLAHVLDPRFHGDTTPPQALVDEIASAQSHFQSLIHFFSIHFITILEGVAVHCSYIFNRMLAEFSAAVIAFSKAIHDKEEVNKQEGEEEKEDDDDDEEEEEEQISYFEVKAGIDGIIGQSHPEVLKYYQYCVYKGHKHFTWTGPSVKIEPRSEAWSSILPYLTSGEQVDFPGFSIYNPPAIPPSTAISAPSFLFTTPKHRRSTDMDDQRAKKHKI